MAKSNLVSIINSLQGKLKRDENVCFRRTPSGGNSVYVQEEHRYASLHSAAQERHRQLIAAASSSASAILSDAVLSERYRMMWKADGGGYSSLQRYVVHLEYLRLKAIDN